MAHDFSLIQLMMKGGWTIGALLVMSVISFAVIYDRWRALKGALKSRESLLRALEPVTGGKGLIEGLETCDRDGGLLAQVAAAGIRAKIEKSGSPSIAMEREAKARLLDLEKRLPLLGTLGNISPYVGLFGTVLGIIRAFKDLSLASAGGAAVVSQGIAEALVATATGLFVAVVSSVAFNLFQSRLDRAAREAELLISELDEKLD